jgi:hypothetical protein
MNFRALSVVFAVIVLLGAITAVGSYTYQLGVMHGVAESARLTAANGQGVVPGLAYWPRPWGFGVFPFFPLLFIVLGIFVARALFSRRRWHYGQPTHCGSRAWHRRMREPQLQTPTQGAPTT